MESEAIVERSLPQCIYLSNHTTKEAFLEQNPMLTADSKMADTIGKVILEATHNKVYFPHFRQQKEMGEKYNRGFRFSILFEKQLLWTLRKWSTEEETSCMLLLRRALKYFFKGIKLKT